jgi:hypothetical protein
MTQRLPFTRANIKKRIDAAHEAGLHVAGILADGTVLTADSRPEPDRQAPAAAMTARAAMEPS